MDSWKKIGFEVSLFFFLKNPQISGLVW